MNPAGSAPRFPFNHQTPASINPREEEASEINPYDIRYSSVSVPDGEDEATNKTLDDATDQGNNNQKIFSRLNGYQTLEFGEPSTKEEGFIEGYWEDGRPIGDMKSTLQLSDRAVVYQGEMEKFNQHYDCHGMGTKTVHFHSGVVETWEGKWENGKLSSGKKTKFDGKALQITHYNYKFGPV